MFEKTMNRNGSFHSLDIETQTRKSTQKQLSWHFGNAQNWGCKPVELSFVVLWLGSFERGELLTSRFGLIYLTSLFKWLELLSSARLLNEPKTRIRAWLDKQAEP